jgi:hypothetical protein
MPSAGVLAVAGATLTLALANALAMPPFTGNDEAAHVSYALAVADGRLPVVTDRTPEGVIPGLAGGRLLYTANHPPLYYAIAGPGVEALADSGRPVGALRLARVVNALFSALAVLAVGSLVARLAPDRPRAPVIAAAAAGLVPAYGFVAGFAYNDGLALAAASGLLAAALGVHRDGGSRRRLALVAVLAAVAALARVSTLPAVLAAAVLCATGRGRRRDGLVPLLAAVLAAGWFYVRNTSRYGDPTGGSYLLDLLDRPHRSSLLGVLVDPTFWSGITSDAWGRFAPLPGPLEPLLAVAVAACLAWQVRRSPTVPWLALTGYAVLVLAAVVRFHAAGGSAHGRYLYPLLVVAGAAVGVTAARARVLPALALVLLTAFSVRHLHGALERYVHVDDRGYGTLEDAALRQAGVPAPGLVLALLAVLLIGCTAVAARRLLARPEPR